MGKGNRRHSGGGGRSHSVPRRGSWMDGGGGGRGGGGRGGGRGRSIGGGPYHTGGRGGGGAIGAAAGGGGAGKQAYWNTGGGRKPTNNRDNTSVRVHDRSTTFSPQGAAVVGNGAALGRDHNGNAKAFLTSSFAQHSQRRRIEFHAATKPSTVFSPSAGVGGSGKISSRGLGKGGGGSGAKKDGRRDRENKQDGVGGKKESVGGDVLALVKLADEKIGLPPDGKGLYPESRVKALLTWKERSRPGPGLRNLGNTCFLNATLQCLGYLPPLAQHLMEGLHSQGPQGLAARGPRPMGGGREFRKVDIMAVMEQHTKQIHTGMGRELGAISPKMLVKNLKLIGKHFRLGRQEDAHEFLRHLLDRMVESCLSHRNVKAGAPNRLAETTSINRIFGGYLRSQLKCLGCGHCSDTYDPFLDLSMELSSGVRSVDVALKRFTSKETLDARNKWRCGGCQKLVKAEKHLTVFKAPNALVVQLKRFVFARRASKIKNHIHFSDELKLEVSGPERSAMYDLTGVVVHAGSSMSTGHYYAYVRLPSSTWACMDDSSVSKVKRQTVLNDQAYLLFYTRRAAPTPRPVAPPSSSISSFGALYSATTAGAAAKVGSGRSDGTTTRKLSFEAPDHEMEGSATGDKNKSEGVTNRPTGKVRKDKYSNGCAGAGAGADRKVPGITMEKEEGAGNRRNGNKNAPASTASAAAGVSAGGGATGTAEGRRVKDNGVVVGGRGLFAAGVNGSRVGDAKEEGEAGAMAKTGQVPPEPASGVVGAAGLSGGGDNKTASVGEAINGSAAVAASTANSGAGTGSAPPPPVRPSGSAAIDSSSPSPEGVGAQAGPATTVAAAASASNGKRVDREGKEAVGSGRKRKRKEQDKGAATAPSVPTLVDADTTRERIGGSSASSDRRGGGSVGEARGSLAGEVGANDGGGDAGVSAAAAGGERVRNGGGGAGSSTAANAADASVGMDDSSSAGVDRSDGATTPGAGTAAAAAGTATKEAGAVVSAEEHPNKKRRKNKKKKKKKSNGSGSDSKAVGAESHDVDEHEDLNGIGRDGGGDGDRSAGGGGSGGTLGDTTATPSPLKPTPQGGGEESASTKKNRKKRKRKKTKNNKMVAGTDESAGPGASASASESTTTPVMMMTPSSKSSSGTVVLEAPDAGDAGKAKRGWDDGSDAEAGAADVGVGVGADVGGEDVPASKNHKRRRDGTAVTASDTSAAAAVLERLAEMAGGEDSEAGERRDDVECNGKRELVEVTGNKAATPWRPARRQKQDLFGKAVGFWADGEEQGEGVEGGDATALDAESLHRMASAKERQAGLVRGQATRAQKDTASRASSFWDRSLDMGKLKKVKAKKDPMVADSSNGNAFQAMQEKMHKKHRRGCEKNAPV